MIGDLIRPVVTILGHTQIYHTITLTITNFRNTFNTNKHRQKAASVIDVSYKSYI